MKEVLDRICALKNPDPSTDQGIEIGQLSHAKVRSSLLRRKHESREEAIV
jgi:hypothetical protein